MINAQFKNTILFFVLFLFMGNIFYGQDSLKTQKGTFLIKSTISLVPGDYITTSVGVPIGFEIKINKKLSFDLDVSYLFNGGHYYLRHMTKKLRGIRTDCEIKWYLKNKVDLTGFYLSTHLLYQYTDANFAIGGEQTTYRNLFATHEKIGWQTISKDRVVFDVAVGVGTRYEYSKTFYTNQLYVFKEASIILYPYDKIYQYGSKWFFSVTGSIKIGWVF